MDFVRKSPAAERAIQTQRMPQGWWWRIVNEQRQRSLTSVDSKIAILVF